MKLNWNFLGGGGYKTKNLPWGEYGYFLELHNFLVLTGNTNTISYFTTADKFSKWSQLAMDRA